MLLSWRRPLLDRVTFLGRVDDIVAHYHACDVFALPSVERSESFGLVQLEAMACFKPVVNTHISSGVSWVSRDGETGLTVPPRNSEALARAINSLLLDRECRLSFGNNILIVRNRTPAAKVDHIAYTIQNWDTDKSVKPAVEAELKRRGLKIRTTEGSFHVEDPEGFEVQMGGKEQ